MVGAAPSNRLFFGPFRLFPGERRLERDGAPVAIGDRALAILILLITQAGTVVGKRQLIDHVWPDTVVEESNLRFQIASLRRILDDGVDGSRYISTVPGRGYCWVAPVHLPDHPQSFGLGHQISNRTYHLPPRLARIVGREASVSAIAAKLRAKRFVSIVGPGGIGKTTVAVATAHNMFREFNGAICFVDLSTLTDPTLVPSTLAAALGLSVRVRDPLGSLLLALSDEPILIILDSCERVIEQAATLAERIFESKSQIHILATSLEPFQVEGEHIFRLPPLGMPTEHVSTAAEALTFPSIQLFVSRVAEIDDGFHLTDSSAATAAEICRRLDGIALAIELTAGRVPAFGIQGTAARLGDRLELLWRGRRTAPPRQQTLAAALEWSHDLLSEQERIVLRRLSVFVGSFTFNAAETITAGFDLDRSRAVDALSSLVAKSLVSLQAASGDVRYRLLDTTRLYAMGKLVDSGETSSLSRRHAEYYRDLLSSTGEIDHSSEIDNIRAALVWAFDTDGDTALGTRIAAASAPIWLRLSLLTECRAWMEKAAACLAENGKASRDELVVQAALGSSLMFTVGLSCDAYGSWVRTRRLARELKDIEYQLTATLVLWAIQIRRPVYLDAVQLAEQCFAIAEETRAPGPIAMAHWMQGITWHHLGRYEGARLHLQQAIEFDDESSRRAQVERFGYDRHSDSLAVLGNLLWQQGQPERGSELLVRAVAEARQFTHSIPLCVALSWRGFSLIFAGNQSEAAEECVAELHELTARHRIESYHGVALCLDGLLQSRRGLVEPALAQLTHGLTLLSRTRYQVFHPILMSEQLRLSRLAGRPAAECSACLASPHMRLDNEHWGIAEVLRIRGDIALLPNGDGPEAAETLFIRAIGWARQQNANLWETRAVQSLARLLATQQRADEARVLLGTIGDSKRAPRSSVRSS